MQTAVDELEVKGKAARKAARKLAKLSGQKKDRALLNIADALESRHEEILEANEKDYQAGRQNGLTDALLDRLLLTPERLEGIATDVRGVEMLPDPVGETIDMRTMPNGLQRQRRYSSGRQRGHTLQHGACQADKRLASDLRFAQGRGAIHRVHRSRAGRTHAEVA